MRIFLAKIQIILIAVILDLVLVTHPCVIVYKNCLAKPDRLVEYGIHLMDLEEMHKPSNLCEIYNKSLSCSEISNYNKNRMPVIFNFYRNPPYVVAESKLKNK